MGRKGAGVAGETVRKVALACIAAIVLSGCGYRAGFTMPEGMDTIYVAVFENKTFYRGLDFELTQAVKREIQARTDLRVVREEDADILLFCTLESVRESVLREENDVVQEADLAVSLSVVAKDREGNILYEGNIRRTANFVVVLGEDDKTARARAMRQVGEELVYRMAEKWGWKNESEEAPPEEETEEAPPGEEPDDGNAADGVKNEKKEGVTDE